MKKGKGMKFIRSIINFFKPLDTTLDIWSERECREIISRQDFNSVAAEYILHKHYGKKVEDSPIPKEFWQDHELDVDAIMSDDPNRPQTKPIKKSRQKPDIND